MKLGIVGTGKVATVFAEAFLNADQAVHAVVGRNPLQTATLARRIGGAGYDIHEAPTDLDLLIIAVSDDAIGEVANQLPQGNSVVAHTSGTSALDKLAHHQHCGVLWPIQSLTSATAGLRDVPMVIEGNSKEALHAVMEAATILSDHVVELPFNTRQYLHLAAVIMSNFPVHLMAQAGSLLKAQGVDPDLLLPLWKGMSQRVAEQGMDAALTGPARRGDTQTVHTHLNMLAAHPELQAVYRTLSEDILRKHHGQTDL